MIAEIRQRLRIERLTTQDWPTPTAISSTAMPAKSSGVRRAGRAEPGRVDRCPHDSTRPRKIPVGRTSSTTTRMTKEIASL